MKKLQIISVFIVIVVLSLQSLSAQQKKSYFLSKTITGPFERVTERVENALVEQGFGIVTELELDVRIKDKLEDVEMKPYKILGPCNASTAYEALQLDENIGLFLPCKVLIKDMGHNKVEVVMMNPSVLMEMLGNKELELIGQKVTDKFKAILKSL